MLVNVWGQLETISENMQRGDPWNIFENFQKYAKIPHNQPNEHYPFASVAGKNQTFMFFVAVIHSEQHTIYVAPDKKVQLVSPFLGHIGII